MNAIQGSSLYHCLALVCVVVVVADAAVVEVVEVVAAAAVEVGCPFEPDGGRVHVLDPCWYCEIEIVVVRIRSISVV